MTRLNRYSLSGYLSFSGFLLTALVVSVQANADVVNGSFENFYNGWTAVGPNSAVTSVAGVNPTDGSRMSFLNNGAGSLPLGVHGFIIDSNLGLPAGSFSTLIQSVAPNSTEGATLFQTFDLDDSTGLDCEITFDYNFLTNETLSVNRNNDFAFYSLFDGNGNLAAAGAVSVFTSTFVGASGAFASQTGWNTVTIGNLVGGQSYSLLFGVFDDVSTSVDSALLVDNIQVNCVPEPSSAMMLGLATMSTFGFRRRRA